MRTNQSETQANELHGATGNGRKLRRFLAFGTLCAALGVGVVSFSPTAGSAANTSARMRSAVRSPIRADVLLSSAVNGRHLGGDRVTQPGGLAALAARPAVHHKSAAAGEVHDAADLHRDLLALFHTDSGAPQLGSLGKVETCSADFRFVSGQGRACPTAEHHWKIDLGQGRFTVSHGPDLIKAFENGQTGVLGGTPRAPVCTSQNPAAGYGYRAILAYPTDVAPNETVASIRARIAAINGSFFQAAVESGSAGGADLVFDCDATGQTRVDVLALPITQAQGTFDNITKAIVNRGYTSGKLAIYWEGASQYGGQGTLAGDETNGASNLSNQKTIYGAPFFAIDYNSTNEVWLHEIGHTLGAVSPNAPYSTGTGGHCFEGRDVLCYTDGGSKDPGKITWNCNDGFDHFDCNHDTYFDAAIGAGQGGGAGSYLDTHWNIGGCYDRYVVNAHCTGGGSGGGNGGGTDTQAPSLGAVSVAIPSGYTAGPTVPVRVKWSANDASGIAKYSVWLNIRGTWVDQSSVLSGPTATSVTFALSRGDAYRVAFTAEDGAGNWTTTYGYSRTFTPKVYDDRSVTYSAHWTRYASSTAFGGYEVRSATPGATASFRFTGAGVAWITPESANRGRAYVFVDGAYVSTVDLYRSSTLPRAIAFSRSWSAVGTHTITIEVVGSPGRPTVDVDAFSVIG